MIFLNKANNADFSNKLKPYINVGWEKSQSQADTVLVSMVA